MVKTINLGCLQYYPESRQMFANVDMNYYDETTDHLESDHIYKNSVCEGDSLDDIIEMYNRTCIVPMIPCYVKGVNILVLKLH